MSPLKKILLQYTINSKWFHTKKGFQINNAKSQYSPDFYNLKISCWLSLSVVFLVSFVVSDAVARFSPSLALHIGHCPLIFSQSFRQGSWK